MDAKKQHILECFEKVNWDFQKAQSISDFNRKTFCALVKKYKIKTKNSIKNIPCEICELRFKPRNINIIICDDCNDLHEKQMEVLNKLTHRKCRKCQEPLKPSRYYTCETCEPSAYRESEDITDECDDMDFEYEEKPAEMRKCCDCEEVKIIYQFPKYKNQYRYFCKDCSSERSKERWKKQKELKHAS